MLFSSITFLYTYFLPVLLCVYFAVPKQWRNMVLLAASLFFYFWGEQGYTLLMLASSLSGWLGSLVIERFRGHRGAKAALAVSLCICFGFLCVFKYADFFVSTANSVLRAEMPLPRLLLPIGISFYTFQIAGYVIDVYRGDARAQRNFFTFFTYVALFPQLIAGPIVRYTTVERELKERRHSLADFGAGARRFVLGLAKKVLLANTMYGLCNAFYTSDEHSVLFAWLYITAYALHLYFDFSGYSDMALGLGRIFGFHFLENFNYPYISQSVTEFWRRWHISLGTWFRDYVYIPMGGNRVPKARHVLNILVVWLLTGFWHGAGWSFILWGLYFALLLMAEKFFLLRALKRLPRVVGHLYTLAAVLFSFVLFDAHSLGVAVSRVGQMLGIGTGVLGMGILAGPWSLYYLRSYAVPILIAVIAATPLPKRLMERWQSNPHGRKALFVLEPLTVAALLILVTAYLIDGSFNPFIYFRF